MKPQNETPVNPDQASQPAADGSAQAVGPRGQEAKAGIGGCLLYPLFFLVVQPMLFVYVLLTGRKSPFPMATYRIVWPYLVYDLALVAAVAILLVLFARKKETLPQMFILFLLIFSVLSGLLWSTLGRLPETRVFGRDPLSGHMVMLLQCLILVPYFALSDRVKNTFLEEFDDRQVVDRLVRPMAAPGRRLYGWLTGRGRKVILITIAFVVAVFLFDWLVDSIVLNVFLS